MIQHAACRMPYPICSRTGPSGGSAALAAEIKEGGVGVLHLLIRRYFSKYCSDDARRITESSTLDKLRVYPNKQHRFQSTTRVDERI